MRIIIAGSRTIKDYKLLKKAVMDSKFHISKVIEGGAKGVDRLGRLWAVRNGVPYITYNAEWDIYGKSAGMIRNNKMSKVADGLIALWDGSSRGTKNMIDLAVKKKLKVHVHIIEEPIPDNKQITFLEDPDY